MEIRYAWHPEDVKHYTTDEIRNEFLIDDLFAQGEVKMVYSHVDRMITGSAVPTENALMLSASKELGVSYFLERRELGIINIGAKGTVILDGVSYELNARDGLYVGMGTKEVSFESADAKNPAKFYFNSAPAHTTYPTVKIDITQANHVPCGSAEECNRRVINQYLHPDVLQTCQLSMGLTELDPGSNWNTMPCHTHDRRMEVYLYIDMDENTKVFHMMGEPNETRHIVMGNEQAVISPSWSIHTGVGTKNYSFIWSMVGENLTFTDMDHVDMNDLK